MDASPLWPLAALVLGLGGLVVWVVLGTRHAPPYVGPDDWRKYREQLDSVVSEMLAIKIENAQLQQTILTLTAAAERTATDTWLRDQYLQELEGGVAQLPKAEQSLVLGAITAPRPRVLHTPPVVLPPPPRVRHQVTTEAIRDLVAILAAANWIAATEESRTTYLLTGLAPRFTQRLSRSTVADTDIVNIVITAMNFSDSVMCALLDNAANALDESTGGARLRAWRDQWGFAPTNGKEK